MDRRTSIRLEMGARALEFSHAHPVDSPGYASALRQLEELLARADQLGKEQERGITEVRTATARKKRLKRMIRRSHLFHLARVAERAAREVPELAQKFDLPRLPLRNLAFRTVARTMLEAAQQQKELLIKHGLVEEVLESLGHALDQFDDAVERGAEGRRVHIGAAANLTAVSDEVVQVVKVFDGYNRVRFGSEPDLLRTWNAASNPLGPPRAEARTEEPDSSPDQSASGGEIKPAA